MLVRPLRCVRLPGAGAQVIAFCDFCRRASEPNRRRCSRCYIDKCRHLYTNGEFQKIAPAVCKSCREHEQKRTVAVDR